MRVWLWVCVLVTALAAGVGCRTRQAANPKGIPSPENPILAPSNEIKGKIARVNPAGRFVVVVFSIGQLPKMEQRLNVYRAGLKTAELKITGPQMDDTIVADIIAGETQEGDIVGE